MPGSPRRSAVLWLLLPLFLTGACKAEPDSQEGAAPGSNTSPLHIEIVHIDTSGAARGQRPFIAGERIRITLRMSGGRPPYDLQLSTSVGDPRLASGSAEVQASEDSEIETGIELPLASEVPGGSYALVARISDQAGRAASARSQALQVVGADAELVAVSDEPPRLRVVDVAGRPRRSFYRGEELHIRAELEDEGPFAVGILAADERPFMPMRRYEKSQGLVDLPLRVPRLARVGEYRVDFASEKSEASVPLRIVGKAFPPAAKPSLSSLRLLGGKDRRVPRGAALERGESLRIEAVCAGIRAQANARLRLRDRASKVVAKLEAGALVPADPDPRARMMLSFSWEPPASLTPGRYVLEIELAEGEELATLYREVLLR